jgi:ribonuclease PH
MNGDSGLLYSTTMIRNDGRRPAELRPVTIELGFLEHAEGSALITMGGTTVLCAVTCEDRLPRFAMGTGSGWITAEYSMLPRSTYQRTSREKSATSGRTAEIQRLIGRSLRSVARLDLLGERTFTVDCDVIRADGGTRTASITGAYVALVQAFQKLVESEAYTAVPVRCGVAAVSCGLVDDVPLLDLDYSEDFKAAVDFNVVMTEAGEMVELQGTGESRPFTREEMDKLIDLADAGIRELLQTQTDTLKAAGITVAPPEPAAS